MSLTEIRTMRINQVITTNALLLFAMFIIFMILHFFDITSTHFFFVLGLTVLLQGILGLIKGDSAKSFIPIFEKVANYERGKLGKEWRKEKKTGNIFRLILSGILFYQSYMYRYITDYFLEIDFIFMAIIILFLLVLINVSMFIRFRKIDLSSSESDLKQYTLESNLIGGAIGIVFTMIVFVISIIYLFSGT